MKTILSIITVILFTGAITSQTIDYNAGTIHLIPDKTFLPDADWNALFYDWKTANEKNGTGFHRDFTIAPDGRVIISNRSNYSVYILDKTGKMIKTFGKQGGKPGEFLYRQDFHGILDSKYLIFSDHQGRINVFDLDGVFIKMITIDFMPLKVYPGNNGKIIIKGHVPMGTGTKYVLASLDYNTEKYKVFFYYIKPYKQPDRIVFPSKMGGTQSFSSGHNSRWITKVTPSGKIISAVSNTSEVKVFSLQSGSYVESIFDINITPTPIAQEDKDAYYDNFKNMLKEGDVDTVYAEKIKNDDFFPDHMPYYYNILSDESSNCMFFIYNNDDKDHLFKAYSTSGEFLGQSEFITDDYDILFQTNPVIIKGGYLYATALKEGANTPLRIVRFRMVLE